MTTQAELTAALEKAKEREAANTLYNKLYSQENMLPQADPVGFVAPPRKPEVNTFGDTAAEFSKPAIDAMKFYGNRMVAEDRSPLNRVKDAGMAGLMGLGSAYAGGAGLLGDLLGGSRTMERKAARDMMLFGEVAIPELAGVPSAVSRLAREGAQLSAKQAAAQAAQRANITPTLGMQGPAAGMIEAGLDKVPFTTGPIRDANARVTDQMNTAIDKAVDKVGVATTNTGAGEALIRGVGRGALPELKNEIPTGSFVRTFQDKSNNLYSALDKKIGFKTKVQAPNALETVKTLTKYAGEYPEINNFLNRPKFQNLLGALEKNTKFLDERGKPFQILNEVPYELLSDLRSSVGSSISKIKGPLSDLGEGELKRLYGALSEDMKLAAQTAGPDAIKAFQRANNYYAAGTRRIDTALTKITNAATPEKAYDEVLKLATADSPRGSTRILAQIKESLPKEEWSTVAATMIRKLGEAPPGVRAASQTTDAVDGFAEFSPATFLTKWNKMDKGAKLVLTSGNIPQAARRELDDLALTAQRYKERPVSAGSSPANAILTLLTIGSFSPVGAVKTFLIAGGTFLSAKAMTSATVLKAVNKATAGDFGQLRKLAREDGPFGSEAATLLRLVGADQAKQEEPR